MASMADVASGSKEKAEAPKITSENAYKLSTYDMRQELVRRECLDMPEADYCHNVFLKRLMTELVKDEQAVSEQHTEVVVDKAQLERDAAKALREQKKAEALARSKARQADPAYFQKIQNTNLKPEKPKMEEGTGKEEEEEEEEDEEEDDPFRTYKSTGRSKIHIS